MKYLDKRDNADIIERIRRRYFLKGSACVFLSLFVLVFFYLYAYGYFADRLGMVNGVMACLIGMAAPFFLLKLHKDVFDRSWEGKIVSRKIRDVSSSGDGLYFNRLTRKASFSSATRQYITLTVHTGKDVIILDRPGKELAHFGAGERLRHIKGTKYLQSLRQNGVRDCVMCGALVREEGNTCPHCGMSMVRFEVTEDAVS